MIWHVIQAFHGERRHSLVHDFIGGHQAGRHGNICYCRPIDDTIALALPEGMGLAYLTHKVEIDLVYGKPLMGNNLGGFKWTKDIRTTSPSGWSAVLARPTLPLPGQPAS